MSRIRRKYRPYPNFFRTIPPSKIRDFAHLPLHKGGLGAVRICKIYFFDTL